MAGEGAVRQIKLGSQGPGVSAQGFGCAGLTMSAYGPVKPEEDMIKLIHHAISSGITLLDTSDFYGPHTNEILIGKALKGGLRKKVVLATKFGYRIVNGEKTICGDPAYVREACEASLKRLGVDYIDLYYQHRVDTTVPIEVTMGELKKLVEEAVQLEWSLWTRDVEEEIIPTCRELGIGIVAYSPLGRGFFAVGPKLVDNMGEGDFRKLIPRFQPENMENNKLVFERVNEIATRKGCTPSQLALAWVHHQGDDVCPIPGTTKIENFNQNIAALSVILTPEDVAELQSLADAVKGFRQANVAPTWLDSETPPLSSWKY
ncbi:hypothetical protein Ancab_031244 [Ancistrocladus abbreviatus]